MDKNKKINTWIKENKWRLQVLLPKEYQTPVKARAKQLTDGSVTEYIRQLIENDLKSHFSGGGDFN